MDFKPMIDGLATAAEENVKKQLRSDDYIGDDGFLHCGKCGKSRQKKLHIFGEDRIVWCICNCRDEELKAAEESRKKDKIDLLKRDGFCDSAMIESTFENDSSPQCEESVLCRNYVKNFAHFYEKGKGLLLTGGVGTGKTFYATCIANALMDNLHPVLFTSIARYIRDIERDFASKNDRIEYLNKFALVVFDDFGVERSTQYTNELIFSLIDGRIRTGKPMIITTNITIDDFKEPNGIDNSRIYDRILSKCLPVIFTGKNRRRIAIKHDYDEDMTLLKGE